MKILRYIASGFFILLSFSWLSSFGKYGNSLAFAGFFILITAIFIAPFMGKFLNRKIRLTSSIAAFSLVIVFSYFHSERLTEANKLKNDEANKVFAKAQPYLFSGKYDSAALIAKQAKLQYSDTASNPAVSFLDDYDKLNFGNYFRDQLIALSESEYGSLKAGVNVKPFLKDSILNARFIAKLIESEDIRENLLGAQKRKKEIEAERAAAAKRQENINYQFNAWDGSHRELETLIKKSMNDPDSYEHVETRYADKGNHLIVSTVFRGKNAFNATVKNSVTAKISLSGQVLEIIEQSW
jgi:hypothetical protein